MKSTYVLWAATAASILVLSVDADAHYVRAPLNGKVTATKYYSSGAFHGAVDIAGGTCGSTGVNTAMEGTLWWSVTIRTTYKVCYGNGDWHHNEVKHTFSSGWAFRQYHFNKSGYSYSRSCDRCTIGTLGGTGLATGPHAHLQYDKYGTKNTTWWWVSKGQYVYTTQRIGYTP
jgi:hypothetical protein